MSRSFIVLTFFIFISFIAGPVISVTADGEVPPNRSNEEEKAEIVYTDYNITLKQAVDIQVNAAARPITDKYKDDPAFIHKNDFKMVHPKIATVKANIRTAPSINSEVAFQFPKNTPLHIIGVVRGEDSAERIRIARNTLPIFTPDVQEPTDDLWYKMAYRTHTYFIHPKDVTVFQVETTKHTQVYQGPTKKHHVFGELEKGEALTIADIGMDWFQVNYKNWRIPTPQDVTELIHPNGENQNMFQHIRLDATIGVPSTELDRVLENKGILEGLGEAFIAAGEEHGINEAYLIAHALLETGLGTSDLATGVEVGLNKDGNPTIVTDKNRETLKKVKTTYNMFGIGAADSCPLECGAKTAYENEWFTPETAVKDGAAWIGEGYIYNEFKQNTLYKMKWNPKMAEGHHWKQYATDIGWAEKQTTRIKEIYDQLTNPKYYYDMPIYLEK